MKRLFLLLALVGILLTANAQNNHFPIIGDVGIGTTTPASIGSYRVLDIVGDGTYHGGYIRLATSDASGVARIFNTGDRLLFDLLRPGMYFQWRNSSNDEIHRLNQNGSAIWRGTSSSYTEVNSNAHGQYLMQYANNGTTLSWIIRGYANADGIQAQFKSGDVEVNGMVRSKEVKVEATGWPDYVFSEEYKLIPLEQLKIYIHANKHLPGIPVEAEVSKNGVKLGAMNAKLLEKIEELTLYLLQQSKKLKQQQMLIGQQQKQINEIMAFLRK